MIELVAVLCVIGLLWWLVNNVIPLPPPVRIAATVVMTLLVCVWLLDWAGVTHFSLRR